MTLNCLRALGCWTVLSLAMPVQANVEHLTWATQRFGNDVVTEWRVNTTKQEVIMAVSRSWETLSYLERYRLVNHIGGDVANDQYRLRVIDPQGATRATYGCAPTCALTLEEGLTQTVPLKASLKFDRLN